MINVGPSYTYLTSAKSCLSQIIFLVQQLVSMYSASVLDNAMVGCFLHFHEMTPTPTKYTYPLVDHWLFASPAQSASQKPLKPISLPPRHILKSKLPFKYLMIYFTTIQWDGPAYDMKWLTLLTANAILALVATIAYIKDLTPALYGTPFIFLFTFINSSSQSLIIENSH